MQLDQSKSVLDKRGGEVPHLRIRRIRWRVLQYVAGVDCSAGPAVPERVSHYSGLKEGVVIETDHGRVLEVKHAQELV